MSIIVPVYFRGPVECEDCQGTNMVLKNISYLVTALGQNGDPLDNVELSREYLECPKCGRIYDVERDGIYVRIKGFAPMRFESRKPKNTFTTLFSDDTTNPFVKEK